MGGKSEDTTTVQRTEPWGPAQPSLRNLLGEARNVYSQGLDYYPFSTVVPFTNQTESALQGTEARATQGNPLAGLSESWLTDLLQGRGATQNLTDTASGAYLNNNPAFNEMLASIQGPVFDAVNSQFSAAGRTGSPAHAGSLTKEFGNIAANLRYQDYARERQNQLGAAGQLGSFGLQGLAQAPGVYDFGYADLGKLANVGAAREIKAGQTLQDLQDRWKFSQEAPWTNLAQWAQIVNPIAGQGGVTTTTGPSNAPSGLQQGLGAALAIASLF